MSRWAVLLMLPAFALGMVIQKINGAGQSEISHASSGGGTHIYISGTDIGSAFAPPKVFIGINADAECVVQPFTSNRNRLHCIISPENLPAPDADYNLTGRFVTEPMRVLKEGRLAQCWHVGGLNHNCMVVFDVGATPRVYRMLTPVVESGSLMRVVGRGIDGGVAGDPKMMAMLYRGLNKATGSCGQKDCQASNVGTETVGCITRLGGDEGDGALGQESAVATAFSSDTEFGCRLDALASGLSAGFFNLSLYANDVKHRGNAYLGFSGSGAIDLSTGSPFDAELLPRISSIYPKEGSLAGGTDLTIVGTGFGSDTAALRINVGSASCAVTSITDVALYCRIEPLSSGLAEPPVAIGTMKSSPGERGARWQWATGKHVLLPSFATPVDWTEAGTTTFIDGWFEAPVDGEVTFMLRQDAVSKLYWSGSDIANRTTTLASVTSVAEHLRKAVKVEKWTTAIQLWRSSSDYYNFTCTLCEGDVHLRPDSAPDETLYDWNIDQTFSRQSGASILFTRQSGEFQAHATGTYVFFIATSLLAYHRFFIDEVQIIRAGPYGNAVNGLQGSIFLTRGQWYRFELQHFAESAPPSSTTARVEWLPPGDTSRTIFAPYERRVWPSLQSTSSAVSPRVTLVSGQRYWLGLECNHSASSTNQWGIAEVPPCAVGARMHTTRLPVDSSIERRRLTSRTRVMATGSNGAPTQCDTIRDHLRCCASFDLNGDPCVPAISLFNNGRPCMNSQWVVGSQPTQQAACPARRDATTPIWKAREKLGNMVSCHTLTDRVACSSAIDGRTQAIHLNQPCMAASTMFANGNVCETARYVKDLDPTGTASLAEAASPYMHVASGRDILHHEVQSITLTQASTTKLEQTITFTAVNCSNSTSNDGDCIGISGGTVQLALGDLSSEPISITSTGSDIPSAFRPLLGDTYSGVTVISVVVGQRTVTWVLALTTPWTSCTNQLNLPLLSTVRVAKVTANVTISGTGSCLSGGIDLAYGNGNATAFLPWAASEAVAAAIITSLLPSSVSIGRTDNSDA
ncbi:fibrocystin [Chrysochromulina tobinii]|uniref:Fibrocystin n=1 Tax=Chrysochromulina tobinii TaxID=1460289 RepID=A0A0M0JY75_9EUKA|nr:fibrocystin [Chrysochromulina tobinii]|eukprot:KOO31606.1 fibrocystin [Chrysochromulina sp. CCMP291]